MSRFERTVLARLGPGWWAHERAFYKLPAGHLLCGFRLETTPTFQFVVRLCSPLCDRVDENHLHYLTFGERLPGEYVVRLENWRDVLPEILVSPNPSRAMRKLKRAIKPGELVERVNANLDRVLGYQSLEVFAAIFAPEIDRYQPASQRHYAAVLILLGRYEAAAERLRACLPEERASQFAQDTSLLLDTLNRAPADAVALLGSWEAETRQKFGIP